MGVRMVVDWQSMTLRHSQLRFGFGGRASFHQAWGPAWVLQQLRRQQCMAHRISKAMAPTAVVSRATSQPGESPPHNVARIQLARSRAGESGAINTRILQKPWLAPWNQNVRSSCLCGRLGSGPNAGFPTALSPRTPCYGCFQESGAPRSTPNSRADSQFKQPDSPYDQINPKLLYINPRPPSRSLKPFKREPPILQKQPISRPSPLTPWFPSCRSPSGWSAPSTARLEPKSPVTLKPSNGR